MRIFSINSFEPVFITEKDKLIIFLSIECAIVFGFIPFLIVMLFFKKNISENSKRINDAFFNFTLILFLMFLVAQIALFSLDIPIVVAGAFYVLHLIIVAMAMQSIQTNKSIKVPNIGKIIK